MDPRQDKQQDKQKEIAFFDRHAADDAYDVFTPASNARLIQAFARLSGLSAGARVADLGCGSGAFTDCLRQAGYDAIGLDLSPRLIAVGRERYPGLELIEGDVERLPFPPASLDGVLLSGVVHHLPEPSRCAAEVHRVLRRGGRFVAFDPNRMNPFMWLYRDHASPFYSPIGVTENERPVLARQTAETFRAAGFEVGTDYISGLSYRYIASSRARALLPVYNAIDAFMAKLPILRKFHAFVLTYGTKP
jgi:SAM-dependent methyltransferase